MTDYLSILHRLHITNITHYLVVPMVFVIEESYFWTRVIVTRRCYVKKKKKIIIMGPINKCNNPLNLKLHVLSATLYTPPPPAAGFLKNKLDTLLAYISIQFLLVAFNTLFKINLKTELYVSLLIP